MALYDNPNATNPTPPAATTSPLIDPYTRGLVAQGIKQGQMYDIVSQQGYEAERARREALLRESIVPAAQATLETGLRDVRSTMERGGKLSSSAAVEGQMRTSELYGAQVAGQIAQGTLGLYEQLGAERNQELNRIAASGTTATEAETQRYGVDVNRQIAQIQDYTNQKIAQLNADTTLTVEQKRIEIAREQNASQEKIAGIQATTAKDVAAAQAASAKTVAEIQTAPAMKELLASINPATGKLYTVEQAQTQLAAAINPVTGKFYAQENAEKELMSQINPSTGKAYTAEEAKRITDASIDPKTGRLYTIDLELAKLKETTRQFDISTTEGTTEFWATYGIAAQNAQSDQKYKEGLIQQGKDELLEKTRQYNTTTTEGTKQFWANFGQAEKAFGVDKAFKEAYFKLAVDQFDETTRQYNITTTEGSKRFWATYDIQANSAKVDDTYKATLTQNVKDEMAQRVKEFDFTSAEGVRQFNANLKVAQDTLGADTAYKDKMYGLARDQFEIDIQKFNITTTQGTTEFWASLGIQKEAIDADKNYKAGMVKVAQDQLANDMTKFNLGSADQRDQFEKNYELAQSESSFDQAYKNNMFNLSYQTYLQSAAQFDVTNANDMTKFNAMQSWAKEQFDFGKEKQLEYVTAQIDALRQGTKDSAVSSELNNILTVLKDPAVRNEMEAAGLEDTLKNVIETGLAGWLTGDPTDDLTADKVKTWLAEEKAGAPAKKADAVAALKGISFNSTTGKWRSPSGKLYTGEEYNNLVKLAGEKDIGKITPEQQAARVKEYSDTTTARRDNSTEKLSAESIAARNAEAATTARRG